MSEPLAYLDGHWLPQSKACLPLHDAGFVWGATVTDLVRTFRHRLFRLDDHLERFQASTALARVPLQRSREELSAVAKQLATDNAALLHPDQDLALVMFATPGPIGHYAGLPGGQNAPRLGMHTFPLPFERYHHLLAEGARLVVPATRHLPQACLDPRIKQRSRLHWWVAEQEVHDVDPGASALLLDTRGCVTETAAANLLVVCDGRVLTPRRACALNGVSLQVVEELCADLSIPFAEVDLTVEDCQRASEAMLTSTGFCLAPVQWIQGQELPCPGPIFERLLRAWSEQVGLDIREQIASAREIRP